MANLCLRFRGGEVKFRDLLKLLQCFSSIKKNFPSSKPEGRKYLRINSPGILVALNQSFRNAAGSGRRGEEKKIRTFAPNIPYFSIDNAHLMYNAQPKLFDIPFDV